MMELEELIQIGNETRRVFWVMEIFYIFKYTDVYIC